jgi:hypothetical protein
MNRERLQVTCSVLGFWLLVALYIYTHTHQK